MKYVAVGFLQAVWSKAFGLVCWENEGKELMFTLSETMFVERMAAEALIVFSDAVEIEADDTDLESWARGPRDDWDRDLSALPFACTLD